MKYLNLILVFLLFFSCGNASLFLDRENWLTNNNDIKPDTTEPSPDKSFCELYPADFSCLDYCEQFPGSIECNVYCIANPDDPNCDSSIDCSLHPNEPACQIYCDSHPRDPACQGVTIIGYGTVGDIFVQIDNFNMVDIIWVIDDSGSMKDKQVALANNFRYFIEKFLEDETNFKMGITTTDVGKKGEFVGAVPVLSSSMSKSEIYNNFISNVNVGISGSGWEQGLEASSMAVENNWVPKSKNYNFLRENAFLAIIIVSDENDISPDSTESYINRIIASKGSIDKVAIYSIVDFTKKSFFDPYVEPIDYGLYSKTFNNPGGLRYITASEVTGGFSRNIFENFADSLLEIGSGIRELIQRYPLHEIPLLTSVRLKINGVEIPYNIKDGWTYDPISNSILFKGSFIPPAGSFVEIFYTHVLY